MLSTTTHGIQVAPETLRRGQRLAERQRAHLFELELTGRWRHYFKTREALKAKIEAASQSVALWEELSAQASSAAPPA
jgi:hypothetical protein